MTTPMTDDELAAIRAHAHAWRDGLERPSWDKDILGELAWPVADDLDALLDEVERLREEGTLGELDAHIAKAKRLVEDHWPAPNTPKEKKQ